MPKKTGRRPGQPTKRSAALRKAGSGRPSKFTETMRQKILELTELGLNQGEIAEFIGIHTDTILKWKKKYPDFFLDLKLKALKADKAVEKALFSTAVGFEKSIQTVTKEGLAVESKKYFPPNPTAQIFWMKARRKWRDNDDQSAATGNITIQFNTPRPTHVVHERGQVEDAEFEDQAPAVAGLKEGS